MEVCVAELVGDHRNLAARGVRLGHGHRSTTHRSTTHRSTTHRNPTNHRSPGTGPPVRRPCRSIHLRLERRPAVLHHAGARDARHHLLHECAQRRAATVGRGQHHALGGESAQPVLPPGAAHELGPGPPERLDGHVRIGEQQQVRTTFPQGIQQPDQANGGLLVVVHHHGRDPRDRRTGEVLPALHERGRLPEHSRGVVPLPAVLRRVPERHHAPVLLQQPGGHDPLRAAHPGTQVPQFLRLDLELVRPHEQVTQFVPERRDAQDLRGQARRPRDRHPAAGCVPLQQLREQAVLLRARDQRGHRFSLRHGEPPHDLERESRGRHHRRGAPRGAAHRQPARGLVPQPSRGQPGGREQEVGGLPHRILPGRPAQVGLQRHGGLPTPGCPHHELVAARPRARGHRLLRLVEDGGTCRHRPRRT